MFLNNIFSSFFIECVVSFIILHFIITDLFPLVVLNDLFSSTEIFLLSPIKKLPDRYRYNLFSNIQCCFLMVFDSILYFSVFLTFFSPWFLLSFHCDFYFLFTFYLLFLTLFSPRFLLSFHHVSYFLFTCSYFLFTDRMKVLVFVALMCLAMVSAGPDYYRSQYYNQYPGLYSSTATKIISFKQDLVIV